MTIEIEDKLDLVKQLIKLMKDNQLTSLKCGDIELSTTHITVQPSTVKSTVPPITKPLLTPEEMLGMTNKEMAELVSWSSGTDEETVLKTLNSRKS